MAAVAVAAAPAPVYHPRQTEPVSFPPPGLTFSDESGHSSVLEPASPTAHNEHSSSETAFEDDLLRLVQRAADAVAFVDSGASSDSDRVTSTAHSRPPQPLPPAFHVSKPGLFAQKPRLTVTPPRLTASQAFRAAKDESDEESDSDYGICSVDEKKSLRMSHSVSFKTVQDDDSDTEDDSDEDDDDDGARLGASSRRPPPFKANNAWNNQGTRRPASSDSDSTTDSDEEDEYGQPATLLCLWNFFSASVY
jgi:hypothetical protein